MMTGSADDDGKQRLVKWPERRVRSFVRTKKADLFLLGRATQSLGTPVEIQ